MKQPSSISRLYLLPLLLLASQIGLANPKTVASWVDIFNDNGQAIFFSSDQVTDQQLRQTLLLPDVNFTAFRDNLSHIGLQLNAIDQDVWVLQSHSQVISNPVLFKAQDSSNQSSIRSFQITTPAGHLFSTKNGVIILSQQQLTSGILHIFASKYEPLTQTITEDSLRQPIQRLELIPAPLALSDLKVSTSLLYFDKNNLPGYVMDGADLMQPNAFNHDPLQSGQGLASHNSAGLDGRSHVRGGLLNETLIELDGMILRSPYHFKDFASLLSTINPNVATSVSHYAGVFPAQYGGRLSAVISVDSERRNTDYDRISQVGLLDISHTQWWSNDYKDGLVGVRSGGYLLKQNLISHLNIHPEFEDAYVKFNQQTSPKWQSSQHFLVSRDELSVNQSDEQAKAAYHDQYVWFKWQYDNLQAHQSNWQLAFSRHHDQRRGETSDQLSTGTLTEDILTKYLQLSWQHQWRLAPWFNLDLGMTVQNTEADIDSQRMVQHNPYWAELLNTPTTQNQDFQSQTDGLFWSYFINLRWQINDRWVTDIGLYNEQARWLPHQGISPRLNMVYQPDSISQWRFGLGRHQQAQRLDELLLSDDNPSYQAASSADLMVIDYRRRLPNGWLLRGETYYKKYSRTLAYYENLFSDYHLIPELYADYQRISPSDAQAGGIELTLAGQLNNTHWSVSYTLAETRDEINEFKVDRSWQQRHTLKTGISQPIGDWLLTTSAQYHSGWPRTELLYQQDIISVSDRNSRQWPDFFQLDLQLNRHWLKSYGRWDLLIQIQNVLDINNPCCTEYSMADSQLISATKSAMPIIPNIQLSLSW
ncbi:TonB-dependent receptor plug domain-containing protein [Marinicella gelatinilytica]|uniref:TonB-dependent receptor plug domain-containing protein n=1 Tax=Marinicella gelatinilytica TaxID=2996017 RepID=UPI0022609CCA|nr:TonB-dependent receptor [Marinicella gelatinilytica]MCX7544702.1 TonB-dependent receptor [Marinicella gelatinilytica]